MVEKNVNILDINTLEIHYYFNDETHTMNAFVQNRCEYEFLGIAREIASYFDTSISIETEPLSSGGLRRWFKIISKEESKKSTITTAIVTALLMAVITTPIGKLTEKVAESFFEDKEIKELEKEKLKLEIKKLKQDTYTFIQTAEDNNVVKKRKSNFYDTLEKYPKVTTISFSVDDEKKSHKSKEVSIQKDEFKEFIITTDDLDPTEIDEADIEIISPVLKKGNYKWMGVYNGIPTPFNMKSNEFKTLVQTGLIQFKNGSTINCALVINRKIDNQGQEKVVSYDIVRVNSYYDNNKPIETPEGKSHRNTKEANKQQLKLDLFASNSDK